LVIAALVIWGEDGRLVDPKYRRANDWAIPGAQLVVLPEAGHLPQIGTPERLARSIRDSIGAIEADW
jgi:pimeloyl-ACP methyl ester carboxylesterase